MISIHKNPTADTRTCDFANVSKDTLLQSSIQHIEDVRKGLAFFGSMIKNASDAHDLDKVSDIDSFHADFVTGFKETGWWDRHRKINRHHLTIEDGIPDDVDLIDVLDFVADIVMAGMARSGAVQSVDLPGDLLVRALNNTVNKLMLNVQVVD